MTQLGKRLPIGNELFLPGLIVSNDVPDIVEWACPKKNAPNRPTSGPIPTLVDCNRRQPRAHRSGRIIAAYRAMGGEQAFLQNVQRFVRIADIVQNDAVQVVPVPADQSGERLLVADRAQAGQFAVVLIATILRHWPSSVSAFATARSNADA